MSVHQFPTADPGSLIELSDFIEQNCRGSDKVDVRLAGRGYAGYLEAWHAEAERLECKMLLPPRIKVSRNHANAEQHELVINREIEMNPNLLEKCFTRIKSFVNADIPTEEKALTKKGTLADNPLNSGLSDILAEHNQRIGAFKNTPRYIEKVTVEAATEEGRLYIEDLRQYGNILEDGVMDFIRQGSGGLWPLIKPAMGMTVEISEHGVSTPVGQSSDFMFKFKWTEAAQGANNTAKTVNTGKKTLHHPLKVTVHNGGEPVVKTITEVPCRINRRTGGYADISLVESQYVSGSHLVLDRVNDELVVVDLGSKHGSFVMGQDLRQNASKKHVIKPGTITIVDLCLGNTPQQVEKNSSSSDRKAFPRIEIVYGAPAASTGTPELGGDTPELTDAANR